MNIVFIIGSGRCGSSLVHELIAKHRDVGFISNVDDRFPLFNSKGSLNNFLFRNAPGALTTKGRLRFAPSEAYRLISKRVSPLYANSFRNLRADDVTPDLKRSFRKFFADRYGAQRKPVFVHKYTGWSRVAFFKEIFPEAKFIHVVRDGRAVANSFLQMYWWTGYRGPDQWYLGPLDEEQKIRWERSGKSFLTLAGIAWEILVTSVEKDASQINGESICTLRYEDFLRDPVGKIKELCAYTDLPFEEGFSERIRASRVNSARENAFRSDLSQSQVSSLTACIADSLGKFGYSDLA